jgi:hypothetical protein
VNGFIWDTDTNPEGISEQIGWTNVGVDKLNVTLRGGQYIFRDRLDSSVTNPRGPSPDDEFAFVGQAEVNYEWASKSGFKFAPGYFGILATSNPGRVANVGETNVFANDHSNHQLVFLPAEVYWNMWGQPWKVYGTYGINLDGDNRSKTNRRAIGGHDQLFNVGLTVGSARNKGSWSLTGEYRFIEAGAANAYFLDSDFNGGLTNASGFIASGSYAFTDNIAGTVTFFNANNLDKTLPATPNPTGRGTGFGSAQVLQVDLSWRF